MKRGLNPRTRVRPSSATSPSTAVSRASPPAPVAWFPNWFCEWYDCLRYIKTAHAIPSWFGFLALEADLAMTFIDCARLHTHHGNFANSVNNARKALAEIQRGLANPAGTPGSPLKVATPL